MASLLLTLVGVALSPQLLWRVEARNQTTEAAITSDAADDNESSESRNQIGVIAANSYRKIHGVPPLEYDPQLAEHAEKWAEKVLGKIVNDGKLKAYYSHPFVEGENVKVLEAPVEPLSLGTAISEWYSEIKNYDFDKNEFSHRTAQFTQLIWKESVKIGLGMAHDPGKNWLVVVARFKPVGNTGFHNSFRENVFPPTISNDSSSSSSSTTTPHPESTHNLTIIEKLPGSVKIISGNWKRNKTLLHHNLEEAVTTPTTSTTAVTKKKSTEVGEASTTTSLTTSSPGEFQNNISTTTTKKPPVLVVLQVPKTTDKNTSSIPRDSNDKVETKSEDKVTASMKADVDNDNNNVSESTTSSFSWSTVRPEGSSTPTTSESVRSSVKPSSSSSTALTATVEDE